MRSYEKQMGRYENLQLIGEGGYASVFIGECTKNKEVVALKMVDISSKSGKKAYKKEKSCLKKIGPHPNVCQLKNTITSNKKNEIGVLVLEKMDTDLLTYLLSKEKLPEQETKRIFRQICEGTNHIHRSGFAHLDLKSDNILLQFTANGNMVSGVKICDFGFCQPLKSNANTLRKYKGNIGTIEYRAPEFRYVYSTSKFALEAADIWSLGIILFSLLTGYFPFLYEEDQIISKVHLDYVKEFTQDNLCYHLILKILNEDPKLRPSIDEILNDAWFAN